MSLNKKFYRSDDFIRNKDFINLGSVTLILTVDKIYKANTRPSNSEGEYSLKKLIVWLSFL